MSVKLTVIFVYIQKHCVRNFSRCSEFFFKSTNFSFSNYYWIYFNTGIVRVVCEVASLRFFIFTRSKRIEVAEFSKFSYHFRRRFHDFNRWSHLFRCWFVPKNLPFLGLIGNL